MFTAGYRAADLVDASGAPFVMAVLYPANEPEGQVRIGPFGLEAAAGAPPAAGSFPLVVISHGSGGSHLTLRTLARYLAARGFVVAMPEHPGNTFRDKSVEGTVANLIARPKLIRTVIDWCFADAQLGPALLPDRVAVIGHSLGAFSALAAAGGRATSFPWESEDGEAHAIDSGKDERIKALVLLAPAVMWFWRRASLSDVDAPILMLAAEHDEYAPPFHAQIVADALRERHALRRRVVAGAGHFSFLSSFPAVMSGPHFAPSQDPPGFDRARFHDELFPEIAAFLSAAAADGAAPAGEPASRSAALDRRLLDALEPALRRLEGGFRALPAAAPSALDVAAAATVLDTVAERLRDNYPYFHPLYAGQMLKPPHPLARTAYALAMWINPNNHALDGGRASSALEKEAVAEIARMFGWEHALGHLCGGGTMANLEALWVAGRLHPGKTVLASAQSHYTHERISGVLGLEYRSAACDDRGRLDPVALRRELERGDAGTVVATMGTTATGSVDPLPDILALRDEYGFRVHADAAYGGYFTLASGLGAEAREAFDAVGRADSIVIDPHKHGLQPYGCGCVVFRDASVAALYRHDSPYTYFSSDDLHLGEISLECSRAGASAVALWATQRLMPLVRDGALAGGLDAGMRAARDLHARLSADTRFITPFEPQLDIVVWTVAAPSVSEASNRARAIFAGAEARGLYLAVAELPLAFFGTRLDAMARDRETIACLRSVLMKPEHAEWIGRIYALLDAATAEVAGR
jgi:glutamate/tyrosine decarboxylase-like PLP-dependent enzyme/predicted dienelactone hydrolase